jgi:hypothetical protein
MSDAKQTVSIIVNSEHDVVLRMKPGHWVTIVNADTSDIVKQIDVPHVPAPDPREEVP